MRISARLGAVLILAVLACGSLPVTAIAADAKLEALEEQAFKQAAALAGPSIVRIQTVGGLDRVERVLTGTGPTTGVVVSQDGYIISSAFNFISKPASILVQLPDGRRFTAKSVATDRSKMLTLLKIDVNDLMPVQTAPKTSIRIGQWAIALGRTFNSPVPSISVGIVSARNRIWGRAIQTDAKVSPVNYGGPLVDIQGRVLGVLVPLSPKGRTETAGVEWYDSGIGFAIPVQDVLTAAERLKSGKDLHAGLMGINFRGRQVGAKPIIDRVRTDSPADKAGIKAGDLIVEAGGAKVRRQAQVKQALGSKYAGDRITIVVKRDQETLRKELTLVAKLLAFESGGFLGILPVREAADEKTPAGVGIRFVYPESPAAKAKLATRDRIVQWNGTPVSDASSLTDLVSRVRPGEKATIVYVRGDAEHTIEVKLASVPNLVPAQLQSAAIAPAEKKDDEDKAEEPPQTGRLNVEMPNHEHSYWAYVPEDYNPAYRYGLMVWIHPNEDTMEAALLEEWKSICEHRGLMILAPKAEEISGWSLNEAGFVKEAVEHFTKTYSIDPDRVFLHSHSKGGGFAYHLAFKYRELFRGVAVVAFPLRTPPPENKPGLRLQFHFVCGEKDNLYRAVQATVNGLRRIKYPASFTTVKDLDHRYPPTGQVREVGRWADCLDRI